MLQCWPRIRLSLSGTDMDPAQYLAETTGSDWLLEASGREGPPLTLSEAITAVNALYDGASMPPTILLYLMDTYPGFARSRVIEPLKQIHADHNTTVDPQLLSIPQLVILSVALSRGRSYSGRPSAAERCLAVALGRQWTLHGNPDALVPLGLAMSICLVYLWARPVHALGILRSIDGAIRQLSLRNSPLLARAYAKLSFILEG